MTPAPPELLHTEHLELRRLSPADEPELARVIADNVDWLADWMTWAVGWTPSSTAEFLPTAVRHWDGRQEFAWLLRHKGEAVGGAAFEWRGEVCEVGYWLAQMWTGHGFATEASRVLTTAAFALPGVRAVQIWHDAANESSRGIPRRLGFREVERRTPARLEAIGRRVGVDVVHEMRREDWRP